jgi:hypothetical protein
MPRFDNPQAWGSGQAGPGASIPGNNPTNQPPGGGAPLAGAPTPTPTPAPSQNTAPTITTDGTPQVGETMTGVNGTFSNGSVVSVAWLLNGTSMSTSQTYAPSATGSLIFRNVVTGAGGTANFDSAPVTVAAATPTPTPTPAVYTESWDQDPAVLLRTLPGWGAYSSTGNTGNKRDSFVAGEGMLKHDLYGGDDYGDPPTFLFGYDIGSPNMKLSLDLLTRVDQVKFGLGGIDEANVITVALLTGNSGLLVKKWVGGVSTELYNGYVGDMPALPFNFELRLEGNLLYIAAGGAPLIGGNPINLAGAGPARVQGTRGGFVKFYNSGTTSDNFRLEALS